MKHSRLNLAAFAGLAALVQLVAAQQPAPKGNDKVILLYLPKDIAWKEAPPSLAAGARVAILDGDPAKPGPFVMRLIFPDGYRVPPHVHPQTERVTVLAGTLHVGMGETFDKKAARAMPAGSYGSWPGGMKHFGWAEGETIIQLNGMGPWEIHYLHADDDPRSAKK